MNLFINNLAPDFTAKAVMQDNKILDNFNLREYLRGSKGVLFFYPLDFTFVCPSELIAFNNRLGAFANKNTKIIAVSVDSHFAHQAWKETQLSKGGVGDIQFPLVSDLNKDIAKAYNVLNSEGVSYRANFLIDEDFIIRHYLVNDLPIGRDIDETLRTIDALTHHQEHGEVCPAGWNHGEQAMKPTKQGVSDYLTSHGDKL